VLPRLPFVLILYFVGSVSPDIATFTAVTCAALFIVILFMLNNLINSYYAPLDQFEVLPIFASANMFVPNNLAILMLGNTLILALLFAAYDFNLTNTYDIALRSIYGLVRSMVKENLYIKKQQYFAVLFFLFVTLLLANVFALIPFSFTVTSSFIFTLFIALTYFNGVNLIGAIRHQ